MSLEAVGSSPDGVARQPLHGFPRWGEQAGGDEPGSPCRST